MVFSRSLASLLIAALVSVPTIGRIHQALQVGPRTQPTTSFRNVDVPPDAVIQPDQSAQHLDVHARLHVPNAVVAPLEQRLPKTPIRFDGNALRAPPAPSLA